MSTVSVNIMVLPDVTPPERQRSVTSSSLTVLCGKDAVCVTEVNWRGVFKKVAAVTSVPRGTTRCSTISGLFSVPRETTKCSTISGLLRIHN